MQLLHTPWSIVFIMYEDSTVAPSVAMLWEKNTYIHKYIIRHARNGTCYPKTAYYDESRAGGALMDNKAQHVCAHAVTC